MTVRICKCVPRGQVSVPPSKSAAHRALICAALADGVSEIRGLDRSEDILATEDCLTALGADIVRTGTEGTVTGTAAPRAMQVLPCRESGSTLRFLIPICLLSGEGAVLTGSKRLMERPLSVYETAFATAGIRMIRGETELHLSGKLTAGHYRVAGNISSQFLTGLLFALPLLREDSVLEWTPPLESASYLELTLEAQEKFGITVERKNDRFLIPGRQTYKPCRTQIEGDESNAAFFGALNVLGSDIELIGRNPQTRQGDRVWERMLNELKQGFCTLSVQDCPDLAPILMTAAAGLKGGILTGTRRLKLKESDRGEAMARQLRKFGADVTVTENEILIRPVPLHIPDEPLYGENDHRIVMSLAVLCTQYGGTVEGAEAVRKSYPGFFEDLKRLNVRMEEA